MNPESLTLKQAENRLHYFGYTQPVSRSSQKWLLQRLPARTFRSCITFPPYRRQRNYGHPEQLGQERDLDVYIHRLADTLMQVHRVLRDDGTLWLNLDDTYHNKRLVGIPWRLALELQRRGWYWRAEIVCSKASTPEPVKDRPTRAHEAVCGQ